MIQMLAARCKLDQSKIIEQIHEQWRELKVSSTKRKDKIESWIAEWENLRLQIISLNLAGTFGDDVIFVSEFLRAGRRWASIFCDTWENQLLAAEKSVDFFKITRAYRIVVVRESGHIFSSYANTTILQSKISDQSDQKSKDYNLKTGDNFSKKGARKCVCGDIHEFEECSYIVSSARKSDWTEDKKIRDQIKQRLQKKPWILKVIKRICNINILDEAITSSTKLNDENFRFGSFSFANIVLRESISLSKSVIYDSGCSDFLTFDKDRFLREIQSVSKDIWIKISNGRMKVKGYDTMQVLGKLRDEDKIIKMKFANIAYVLIISMTLVSFIKLIKEGYDRDMHTKTLVHVATEKKICDIEKHFGVMILEFNLIDKITTIVEKTASIEMLIDQASKDQKRKEKMFCLIINSESIIHEKSDREHIMKLNQSDEGQRKKLSLNNSHSSRQIDSAGGGDHFIKTSNANDGPKGHFIKVSNLKNGGSQKHECSKQANLIITNQKLMRKTHHKDPNRTAKAWWRSLTNGVQIIPQMEFRKRPSIEGFLGGQYEFSKHGHQDMQHSVKLGQKGDNFSRKKFNLTGYFNRQGVQSASIFGSVIQVLND